MCRVGHPVLKDGMPGYCWRVLPKQGCFYHAGEAGSPERIEVFEEPQLKSARTALTK